MAKRTRTVARSAKTGRFVKTTAAKFRPSTTVVEQVMVSSHSVKVARNVKTGRFVKKKALQGSSKRVVGSKIKR